MQGSTKLREVVEIFGAKQDLSLQVGKCASGGSPLSWKAHFESDDMRGDKQSPHSKCAFQERRSLRMRTCHALQLSLVLRRRSRRLRVTLCCLALVPVLLFCAGPAWAQSGVLAFTPGIISTVAGTGNAGYSGDGSAATSAKLNQPLGLALDSAGNLYISDYGNHVVRMVNPTGNISTVAGSSAGPGYSGDIGPATSAQLNQPAGLALDSAGNLYIADSGNHVVRKVDSSHNISTVAGQCASPCSGGFSGDGDLANGAVLNTPMGVAVDGAGNLYIADYGNHRVRRVDSVSGNITTIAGDGTGDYGGDGGAATAAHLNHPYGVALDSAGNLLHCGPRQQCHPQGRPFRDHQHGCRKPGAGCGIQWRQRDCHQRAAFRTGRDRHGRRRRFVHCRPLQQRRTQGRQRGRDHNCGRQFSSGLRL